MTDPRPSLLLTRPAAQSARFAAEVGARVPGVSVVISPILRIVPRVVGELNGIAGVILTSENGAAALAGAAGVAGLRAWCVGDRTACAARALGLDAVSAGGAADVLVGLVRDAAPAGRLVHLRGAESRGAVAERLRAAGAEVETRVVYDQQPEELTAEAAALVSGAAPVLAPVFSPRSAALLGAAWGRAPVWLAAISVAAAEAWGGPEPEQAIVAARPDGAAMLDAVAALCAERSA